MKDHPLAPPEDRSLMDEYVRDFHLDARLGCMEMLTAVTAAFSRLPYENLTKIIKSAEYGRGELARRSPEEVLRDHRRWGTGGTCFSLTAALARLLRCIGWKAEPLLADRSYGPNTHCALRVEIDGRPHLIDPGFLIVHPVPLDPGCDQRILSPFNSLVLRPTHGGARIDLIAERQDSQARRLTYKTTPVDAGEFYRAWDESFDWEMMQYPVLTQTVENRQRYLCGHHYQERGLDGTDRREIGEDELAGTAAKAFNINPRIVARALEVLREKGGTRGTSSSR